MTFIGMILGLMLGASFGAVITALLLTAKGVRVDLAKEIDLAKPEPS
jgi:hypothetical protein